MLIAPFEAAGTNLILSTGFTSAVDSHHQDLMVVKKFPPTLTWVSYRIDFTLVSDLKKGDDIQ